MKKTVLSCCLFMLLSQGWAQKINVDSLVQITVYRNDTVRLPRINPDTLLKELHLTTAPSERIKLIYEILFNDKVLDPGRALYYHHKILDLVRNDGDPIGESVILSELGFTVVQSGDKPEGVKIVLGALQMAEKTGNSQAIGIVYDNLGVCADNTYLRKRYFSQALRFSRKGNDNLFVCFALGNLAKVLRLEGKTDSASYYIQEELELAVRNNIQQAFPSVFRALAENQITIPNKLKYLNYALQLPFTKVDISVKSNVLNDIAALYRNERKIDSALWYARLAYESSMHAAFVKRIAPASLLAILYKGINADSALKYTDIFYLAKDSANSINKLERTQALAFAEQQRQQEAAMQKQEYQNILRIYLFTAIIIFLIVIVFIFWWNNRLSTRAKLKIQQTLNELKSTQAQLIQSEKMASLGELTAGIAHEIQNPLNFVNNFSEVNKELLEELKAEIEKGNFNEVKILVKDIIDNEEKINHHGKRADGIVKGMLQHSRTSSGVKEPTDINALAEEYQRLAYHGLRAKDKSFNATMKTDFDRTIGTIHVIPQDIGRVILNLITNAFYAVTEKKASDGPGYEPTVAVSTKKTGAGMEIRVKDNGNGIPQKVMDKIFQPFFTTKPTGQGTGLGLSLSYDIVKAHGGELKVVTKEGEGAEFILELPA